MHSEHLRNVQISWVAFGWFVGLAIATSIALLLMASGIVSPDRRRQRNLVDPGGRVGWFIGGFSTGLQDSGRADSAWHRDRAVHLRRWFLVNLVFGGLTTGASAWEFLGGRATALALLEQGVAAIAGCWAGYRYAPLRVE